MPGNNWTCLVHLRAQRLVNYDAIRWNGKQSEAWKAGHVVTSLASSDAELGPPNRTENWGCQIHTVLICIRPNCAQNLHFKVLLREVLLCAQQGDTSKTLLWHIFITTTQDETPSIQVSTAICTDTHFIYRLPSCQRQTYSVSDALVLFMLP